MKKVLSLLLAFVLLQAQTWALSGGPVGSTSGSTAVNYIGTYSGTLVPQALTTTDDAAAADSQSSSLGLFSFAQPSVGPATGALVVFIDGAAFNCLVTGIIDPDESSLRAVVDGTSTFDVVFFVPAQTVDNNGNTTLTFTREEFPVFVSGNIDATVTPGGVNTSTLDNTVTPTQVEGLASLDVFFSISDTGTPEVNKTVTFDVQGFKQSDTANPVTFTVGSQFQNGTDNG